MGGEIYYSATGRPWGPTSFKLSLGRGTVKFHCSTRSLHSSSSQAGRAWRVLWSTIRHVTVTIGGPPAQARGCPSLSAPGRRSARPVKKMKLKKRNTKGLVSLTMHTHVGYFGLIYFWRRTRSEPPPLPEPNPALACTARPAIPATRSPAGGSSQLGLANGTWPALAPHHPATLPRPARAHPAPPGSPSRNLSSLHCPPGPACHSHPGTVTAKVRPQSQWLLSLLTKSSRMCRRNIISLLQLCNCKTTGNYYDRAGLRARRQRLGCLLGRCRPGIVNSVYFSCN